MNDAAKYRKYKNSGALKKVKEAIDDLVASEHNFVKDEKWWRHYLGFKPKEQIPATLEFDINSTPGSVRIQLIINAANEDGIIIDPSRQKWLKYAILHQPPFNPYRKKLYQWNNTIYSFPLLSSYSSEITESELRQQLHENWETFLNRDYPQLMQLIKEFPG